MIECHSIHTMRSARPGRFTARLLTYRKATCPTPRGTTGNMIVKIIEADSRDKARRIMERWLAKPDGLSASERARKERQEMARYSRSMSDSDERAAERRALGGEC